MGNLGIEELKKILPEFLNSSIPKLTLNYLLFDHRTVMVSVPATVPEAAVMVVVPPATAVAKPLRLTVATNALDEVQVT